MVFSEGIKKLNKDQGGIEMRIACIQDELSHVLGIVSKAVATKNIMPVLNNIKITVDNTGMICEATDLEIAIKAIVPGTSIAEAGSVLVSGRTLTEVIKKFPSGQIQLEADDKQLHIKSGKSKYNLPVVQEEGFPEFPTCNEKWFTIPTDLLKNAITKVSFATIPGDVRPFVSGVLLTTGNTIKMVATDVNRLALVDISVKCDRQESFVIPVESLRDTSIIPGDNITFTTDGKQIYAESAGVKFAARLVSTQYPKYQQIIPGTFESKIECNRVGLIKALERTSLVSNSCRFKIGENLEITADESGNGKSFEELEITKEGNDLTIGFNVKYLLDFLKVVDSEWIEMAFTGPQKPAKMTGKDLDGYVYILMPLKVA
jgi:DNA polymerase-3 subunit beta